MKMVSISIVSPTIVAGITRYPAENPITVEEGEAQRLVDQAQAEIVADEHEAGGADEDVADDDGLEDEKVVDLKSLAELEDIDLGKATSKPDIIAAIRAARDAKEG